MNFVSRSENTGIKALKLSGPYFLFRAPSSFCFSRKYLQLIARGKKSIQSRSTRTFSHTSGGSLSRRRAFSTSLASSSFFASRLALPLVRGPEDEDPSRLAIFPLRDARRPRSERWFATRRPSSERWFASALLASCLRSRREGRLVRRCRSTKSPRKIERYPASA